MIKGEKRRPKSSSFNSKTCGCDCLYQYVLAVAAGIPGALYASIY